MKFVGHAAVGLLCIASSVNAQPPRSGTHGVFITRRDQLPTFTPSARGTITLREAALGWYTNRSQYMANIYSQYHSGVQIVVEDNGDQISGVIELWDNITGLGSLVPTDYTLGGAPIWRNHNVLVFTSGVDELYWGGWQQSTNGAILAQSVTGSQLNSLMDFTVEWITNPFHRLYVPFTVWTQSAETADIKRPGLDVTCDTFTEDFYFQMAKINVTLNLDIPRINRNYAPIISTTLRIEPQTLSQILTLVDSTDSDLQPFYEQVAQLGSMSEVYASIGSWDGPFFLPAQVGDPAVYPSKYFKLQPPFETISGSRLFTTTAYSDMPLPIQFTQQCNRIVGSCMTSLECNLGSGGSCNDDYQCHCEECAFADSNCAVFDGLLDAANPLMMNTAVFIVLLAMMSA